MSKFNKVYFRGEMAFLEQNKSLYGDLLVSCNDADEKYAKKMK